MTTLLFVTDGPRDYETIPALVRSVLREALNREPQFESEVVQWAHLRNRGFEGKLRFAMLQARDRDAGGVVATVDRDSAPKSDRIGALARARAAVRSAGDPTPIAVGQADPHAEAWLVADEAAVRTVDSTMTELPAATSPKGALQALWARMRDEGAFAEEHEMLEHIAKSCRPQVLEKQPNGFAAFAEELRREIAPLL